MNAFFWTALICGFHLLSVSGQNNVVDDRLAARVTELEAEQTALRQDNDALKANNAQLNQLLLNVTQRLRQLEDAQQIQPQKQGTGPQAVSFEAALGHDVYSFARQNIVVMPQVLNNDGSAYDPAYGKFTAPVNGTYLFLVTLGVYSSSQHAANVILTVDSIIRGVFRAGRSGNQYAESATFYRIIDLQAGQRVWLETDFASEFMVETTRFAGFLLG